MIGSGSVRWLGVLIMIAILEVSDSVHERAAAETAIMPSASRQRRERRDGGRLGAAGANGGHSAAPLSANLRCLGDFGHEVSSA